MIEDIFKLLSCHFLGDYVLQTDFLARTKGENLWHMIAHCLLYTLPFYCLFGFEWYLLLLFLSHLYIDTMKVRHDIGYAGDQFFHFLTMTITYILFLR